MRETNRFFPLRGRHSLVLALLLCLTAQAGVSGEQAMAQPGPALHATASLAPIFKDSDWAAARARRNRICNEQSPDSALGRKKGAESYHQNVLNDAIRRADMEFVHRLRHARSRRQKGRRQQRSDAAGFLKFSSLYQKGGTGTQPLPPFLCSRLRPGKINRGHPEENGQWPRRW